MTANSVEELKQQLAQRGVGMYEQFIVAGELLRELVNLYDEKAVTLSLNEELTLQGSYDED